MCKSRQPYLVLQRDGVEIQAGCWHPKLPTCRVNRQQQQCKFTSRLNLKIATPSQQCLLAAVTLAAPHTIAGTLCGRHGVLHISSGRQPARPPSSSSGGLSPLIMLGTRSLCILPGMASDCPVSTEFQVNTAARVTGASASWFRVTCMQRQHHTGGCGLMCTISEQKDVCWRCVRVLWNCSWHNSEWQPAWRAVALACCEYVFWEDASCRALAAMPAVCTELNLPWPGSLLCSSAA